MREPGVRPERIPVVIVCLVTALHASDCFLRIESATDNATMAVADETVTPKARHTLWCSDKILDTAPLCLLDCGMD
jgi:hypothetical protein